MSSIRANTVLLAALLSCSSSSSNERPDAILQRLSQFRASSAVGQPQGWIVVVFGSSDRPSTGEESIGTRLSRAVTGDPALKALIRGHFILAIVDTNKEFINLKDVQRRADRHELSLVGELEKLGIQHAGLVSALGVPREPAVVILTDEGKQRQVLAGDDLAIYCMVGDDSCATYVGREIDKLVKR